MAFGYSQGAFPNLFDIKKDRTNNYITIDFDYNDFIDGFKLIDNVLNDTLVEHAVIIIHNVFNNNSEITVGDDLAQARLMTVKSNKPHKINTYITDPNHKYTINTDIKIFFPNGTPTQGNGTVIIYF